MRVVHCCQVVLGELILILLMGPLERLCDTSKHDTWYSGNPATDRYTSPDGSRYWSRLGYPRSEYVRQQLGCRNGSVLPPTTGSWLYGGTSEPYMGKLPHCADPVSASSGTMPVDKHRCNPKDSTMQLNQLLLISRVDLSWCVSPLWQHSRLHLAREPVLEKKDRHENEQR